MFFTFSRITMNKTVFSLVFQLKIHQTCLSVATRNASSSSNIDPKKLQSQIDKFLVRKKKLRNKFYDINDECYQDHSNRLTPRTKTQLKQLKNSVLLRERNVSNLIKSHVQDLIDSGELGEEVQTLNLTLTKAGMSSQNQCKIFWEPALSSKDFEISEILNRLSSQIRHILISSNVMNNAPKINFYMDPDVRRMAEIDKICKEHGFNEIPVKDSNVTKEDASECNESTNKNSAFGLEYDDMYAKLTFLKKTDGVDKS